MSTTVTTETGVSSASNRYDDVDLVPIATAGSKSEGLPRVSGAVAADADATSDEAASPAAASGSKLRQAAVIVQLAGINFTASATNGLVIIGLPAITKAIDLPASLAFWPSSVTSLATASALLLAGAVADATSPRIVGLLGCLLTGVFMVAAGAAQTGEQLVAMRALQGVGQALHYAASISLITAAVPSGKARNIAFATWGLSQPLGFSCGLVLGGVMVESIGWRGGWYLYGGLTVVLFALGVWALPTGVSGVSRDQMWSQLKTKVDWIGAALSCAAMTFASYFCAILSTDIYRIKDGDTIAYLVLAVAAAVAFVVWMHYQVKRDRPAMVPNALWKNLTFSSICVTLTLSFAVITCLELFSSLFFQEIQHLSEIQAAIRILPSIVVGVLLNLTMGFFVNRVPATIIVIVSSLLAAGSPLLMAVIDPKTTYWANAFVAQILEPVSCDCLITVGLLVVTEIFPKEKHSIAGAVFNTMYQFGTALGLAIMQIVSTLETQRHKDLERDEAVMKGYRASFWTMFAFMVTCAVVGGLGLRKTGKVGLKRD